MDAQTYDMFRFSGLAHLLAISGLHMGLLCFGFIGFVRAVMALMPHTASRFALHKYASLTGLAGRRSMSCCQVLQSAQAVRS